MSRRVVPQNPPGTTGLKRHPALVPLSRDHHGALMQALSLRRAWQPAPGARAAADYLAFYRDELLGHFDDEEEVVLPRAGDADPEGAHRIREEHQELRALTAALERSLGEGADPRPLMQEIGDLIDDHVRFEERAFFTHVQSRLSAGALQELGQELAARRAARGRAPGCPLRARERRSPAVSTVVDPLSEDE